MEQAIDFNRRYTVEEYFALELANKDKKYEFFGGEIVAMAGTEMAHNTICANLIREFGGEIIKKKKKCRVLTSDQRVRADVKGEKDPGYCYPDVVVVCGAPELADTKPKTLLNPSIIVEVLSRTNSSREMMEKLRYYRAIASLTDALFIDSETVHVMHYERANENEWCVRSFHSLDEKITLTSHDLELSLAEAYRNIDFLPSASSEGIIRETT